MNKKKILMIIILIAFIAIIGVLISKVDSKSSTVENVQEASETKKVSTIEIRDNFFIQQVNDIYLNLEDYIGKNIKMEGLIYSYEDTNGDICYAVVRNTPGCCGSDGLAGIDIRYDGEYPKENTWVEVTGSLGKDTVFGDEIPAIQVTSLTEKEAGTTFVTN